MKQQAALDTLIYAQLLENKVRGSRCTHFPGWHGAYVQAIASSGWIITQRMHRGPGADGGRLGARDSRRRT
ncbi:hypothetical protein ACQKPE_15425 [Pseudomonas sp. NPDC089554]|uniref:hypothetical protein n=1 Tax=Pseudomonas sp. NPDC089554 TaxID=3390653 RepID=UPI003D00755C